MGYSSLSEYKQSPHWSDVERAFRESVGPPGVLACSVCRTTDDVVLCHHTHRTIGSERPQDLTPLCRGHHDLVLDWLRANKKPVDWIPDWIAALKSQPWNLDAKGAPVAQRLRPRRKERIEADRKRRLEAQPKVVTPRTPEQLERDRQEFVALKRRYDQAIAKGRTYPKIPPGYEPDPTNLVLLQMFVGLLTKPR